MAVPLPGHKQLGNSLRPPLRGARPTGPTDPNQKIGLTFVLRRRPDAPALPGHEYWQAVPPGRRSFLSRPEFAARYGAAPEEIDKVAAFCRSNGFTVTDMSVARRSVLATTTVETAARVFDVELTDYATPKQTYRGHEGYVQLPPEIAGVVQGILGFDNRLLGTHASNGGPPGAKPLTPIEVANFYQFPLGDNGGVTWKSAAGQTIGILEFAGGSYTLSDFQSYFTSLNIPTSAQAQVISVPSSVPHFGTAASPVPNDIEVALDVEVAGAIAQGAKIVIYFASGAAANEEGGAIEANWYALVSSAIYDATNKPLILSISWSAAEDYWAPGALALMSPLFKDAAMMGITVLASSGDTGASGNRFGDSDGQPHAHYPASDPWVTGCGGTIIYSKPPPLSQGTWNDSAYNGGATGGGFSAQFPTPSWQNGAQSHAFRGVPDIAGNASAFSGYDLIVYGKRTSALNQTSPTVVQTPTLAGTSAAAPLYAGLIALINANIFPNNITTATSIGFLNPTLYGLPPNLRAIVFQDIADGLNNGFDGVAGYTSGQGWDPCTGWGSINGIHLQQAIVIGYIKENPGCMAALGTLTISLRRIMRLR